MTMRREFRLVCDGCGTGETKYHGTYSSDVREQARKDGWKIGNTDLCPVCRCGTTFCDECGGRAGTWNYETENGVWEMEMPYLTIRGRKVCQPCVAGAVADN